MSFELELWILLALQTIGTSYFAVFEIETPPWRKLLKWSILIGVTMGLTPLVGHWALVFPGGLAIVGLTFHFTFLRRHGIHPFTANPRRRYYDLRGWRWPDDS